MRVVIDTNVLLSGLLWKGTPHTLLSQVRFGVVELVMSHVLLEEFAEVIARPKFTSILQRTTRTHQQILSELHVLADVIAAPPLPHPICRDPDDDAVLACALAAQADWIVSGDDDLLTLKEFQQIPIITATEAMQRLAMQK
ncbi:MAG: putative toxin-antitoxin system toxin component, PIN family [Undibacterium sp.]|nr:putative toxin-antitoxin system toxin component, PIN family [Undibacterium sp.]